MNGRPRDSVVSDIEQGRPALSEELDRLIMSASGLMTVNEQLDFGRSLNTRVAESPVVSEWYGAPDRYLVELDPKTVEEWPSR